MSVEGSLLPSCLPELRVGCVLCVTASEASCPDRVQLVQQLLCKGNATASWQGLQDGWVRLAGAVKEGGGCVTGVNGKCDCPGTGMSYHSIAVRSDERSDLTQQSRTDLFV